MAADAERKQRLRDAMGEAELNALVAASPSDVLLLTGYWPIFANSVAVLSSEGEARLLVPEDECAAATASTDAHVVPYKPSSMERITDAAHELAKPLRDALQQLGLQRGTLGICRRLTLQPASYLTMSVFRDSLEQLVSGSLPQARIIGCDDLLAHQKAVRTSLEMQTMRQGVEIVAEAFATASSEVQPGRRESEVAAALNATLMASPTAEKLGRSYGFFFCMSGPNSATASAAYAQTRERRLQEGDLVMIHANTCADGLWTDITRTYTVGAPEERHEAMRKAISEARAAAFETIRPGAAAREVDTAARDVMRKHGFGAAFRHPAGHGVGYAAANGDALPRIHPASPDVLTEGMTFNIEPAAYFDGYGGMRHCDVVAVTAKGVEIMTSF